MAQLPALDPFTRRRIERFVESHRQGAGQLPTLQDFEAAGIARPVIEAAAKAGVLERFYVTLTNGTVVKGFKLKSPPGVGG